MTAARLQITRTVPLLDYEVQRSGGGRTVIAYAATFGNLYPVRDQQGDYDETINRAAFNAVLGRPGSIDRVGVFVNHATNIHGTPSEKWSDPVGRAEEIKPDARGLLTRTRYYETDAGEQALQMWLADAFRGQSFSGPVLAADRVRRSATGRTVIERMALGLTEYGPALLAPVNPEATLVAIRSQLLDRPWRELTPEERRELIALEEEAAHLEVHDPATTPAATTAAESAPAESPDPGLALLDQLEAEQAQRRRSLT
jgi:phage head maturation protease